MSQINWKGQNQLIWRHKSLVIKNFNQIEKDDNITNIQKLAVASQLDSHQSFLPTLVQFDVNSETKIDFTLKCISHQSGNASSHEEVPSPTDHRNVSSLVHQWIRPSKVDAPSVLGGVEHEGEPEPSSENVFLVIQVKALCPPYRGRVQIVVQSDWIIEHNHVPKMVCPCQNGFVAPSRCTHNDRRGILGISAVVDNVVKIENEALARGRTARTRLGFKGRGSC